MGRSRLLPLSLPTSSPVVIIKFSFFSVSISTLQSIFYNLLENNSIDIYYYMEELWECKAYINPYNKLLAFWHLILLINSIFLQPLSFLLHTVKHIVHCLFHVLPQFLQWHFLQLLRRHICIHLLPALVWKFQNLLHKVHLKLP